MALVLGPASMTDSCTAAVLGSAINQDGRSSGLTAPNGPSQTHLVKQALVHACLQPHDIGTVGVHGTGTAHAPTQLLITCTGQRLNLQRHHPTSPPLPNFLSNMNLSKHANTSATHAGTPLGDPIEVGALGAALSCKEAASQHSLTSSSVKACFGHTEGAAGLTGALLALQSSLSSLQAPVLHLGNLNSYVDAAFGDWAWAHNLASMAPRASKPACGAALAAGTSSFGMSGVNAHLIVTAVLPAPAAAAASSAVMENHWQRQRHWPLPPIHHSLDMAAVSSRDTATVSLSLGAPRMAYLWHFTVQGRALLPAEACLEAAAAACKALHHAAPAALLRVSSSTLLELPDREEVLSHLSLAAGSVQLVSSAGTALLGASVARPVPAAVLAHATVCSPWLPRAAPRGSAGAVVGSLSGPASQACAAQAALQLPSSRVQPASPVLASCVLASMPSASPAGAWACSEPHRSPGSSAAACSAAVHGQAGGVLQLSGARCRLPGSISWPKASKAWQLRWQPVPPAKPATAGPQAGRLLLLSNSPISLQELCISESAATCVVLSVTPQPGSGALQISQDGGEALVSDHHHLAVLLSSLQVDHAFCIPQRTQGEACQRTQGEACACSSWAGHGTCSRDGASLLPGLSSAKGCGFRLLDSGGNRCQPFDAVSIEEHAQGLQMATERTACCGLSGPTHRLESRGGCRW